MYLATLGWDVTGFDISETGMAVARKSAEAPFAYDAFGGFLILVPYGYRNVHQKLRACRNGVFSS